MVKASRLCKGGHFASAAVHTLKKSATKLRRFRRENTNLGSDRKIKVGISSWHTITFFLYAGAEGAGLNIEVVGWGRLAGSGTGWKDTEVVVNIQPTVVCSFSGG